MAVDLCSSTTIMDERISVTSVCPTLCHKFQFIVVSQNSHIGRFGLWFFVSSRYFVSQIIVNIQNVLPIIVSEVNYRKIRTALRGRSTFLQPFIKKKTPKIRNKLTSSVLSHTVWVALSKPKLHGNWQYKFCKALTLQHKLKQRLSNKLHILISGDLMK